MGLKNFFQKIKGGDDMARSIKENTAEQPATQEQAVEQPAAVEQVRVITMEQLIINRLDMINAVLVEGFKQLGVKFDK